MRQDMAVGSLFLGSLISPIPRLQVFLWLPLTHPAICSEALSVSLAWWRGPAPGVAEPEVIPIRKSRAASQQAPYGGLDPSSSEQRGYPQPSKRAPDWNNSSLTSPFKVTVQMSSEPGRNLSAFRGKEAACHRN